MGQPLVKRLTIRSGLHPDSGASAYLAILHVSPSVPAPAREEQTRSSPAGREQAQDVSMHAGCQGCEHLELQLSMHCDQSTSWHHSLLSVHCRRC